MMINARSWADRQFTICCGHSQQGRCMALPILTCVHVRQKLALQTPRAIVFQQHRSAARCCRASLFAGNVRPPVPELTQRTWQPLHGHTAARDAKAWPALWSVCSTFTAPHKFSPNLRRSGKRAKSHRLGSQQPVHQDRLHQVCGCYTRVGASLPFAN